MENNILNQRVSEVSQKLDQRNMPLMIPLLNIVRQEVSRANKVLYGGMALNAYLPTKLRFYHPKKDLPDLDVYSENAKAFVTRVADTLVKRGYRDVEVRCSLHPGTYKLFWDNRSILDVTNVPLVEMKRLRASARKKDGMASLDLLKANAYLELALPDSASYRWKKVFKRIRLFSAPKLLRVTFQNHSNQQLVRDGISFARKRGLPIAGVHAARHYLGLPQDDSAYLPQRALLQVLSEDPIRDAELFAKQVPYPTKVISREKSSFFAPEKVFLYVQTEPTHPWIPLMSLHHVHDLCVSVEKGFVSLFYLLYMEYLHRYRYNKSQVPWLIPALLSHVSTKRFQVQCIGQAPTMQNILRTQSSWKYTSG